MILHQVEKKCLDSKRIAEDLDDKARQAQAESTLKKIIEYK